MKANPTQEKYCDILKSNRTFGLIHQYSVSSIGTITKEFQPARYNFNGVFKQELLDMVAMRVPMPAIFMIEHKDGTFEAVGDYANDLLTTIISYLNDNDDDIQILRRVESNDQNINIIRCNNSPEKIQMLLDDLRANKVIV